jgi:uncharacterized protein
MMMNFIRFIFVILAGGLLLSGCGDRADRAKLQAGETAYRQGDFKAALEVFQTLAEKGNPRAEFFLGEMYLSGSGLPQDYAQALKWANAAADKRSADAQYTLGVMYDSGRGVPQDYVQAHMWYSLSATSGDEQAIRKKAELEIKKMTGPQIERSKQLEFEWDAAHRNK